MVKVALINPPSPFLVDDTVMPPLGIMYLSSYLKSKGINVEIIDLATNNYFNPSCPLDYDIYAFTSTTPQYPAVVDILNNIKKHNQQSIFVIGGAHATAFGDKCRNDGFDCVVSGEGEETMYSISKFVENSENSRIYGIVKARQIDTIDSIPFPDRSFPGFDKYHYEIDGKKATTMITSRGCPFDCYFCCNTWGNKVRLRSAENVLKEAEEIKNMGFEAIQFYDDTFTVNRKRVIDICKGLKDLDMKWRCFIHANTVDRSTLKTMYNSGCIEVGMGVESGDNNILKSINKKISLAKAIEVCGWCHDIGLRIKTFLIIGLPGESRSTVASTIRFLKHAKPDDFDYTIYTPFPNTYIWDNKEKFDIIFDKLKIDYGKSFYKGISGRYKSQVSTSHLTSEEIEKIRDFVDISIRKEIRS